MPKDVREVDTHYIYSMEQFEDRIDRIIEQCELNNARAYIHLNTRNADKIALLTLQTIGEYIASGQTEAVKRAYLHTCGKHHQDKDKKWLIDVDGEDIHRQSLEYTNYIKKLHSLANKNYVIKGIFPTKNGCHIITNPFDLKKFGDQFPGTVVMKDSPTILYVP